tara:strand:- start:2479 stop:2607 length:129 start_codon:yes stop_codon:yes gene_type:complete
VVSTLKAAEKPLGGSHGWSMVLVHWSINPLAARLSKAKYSAA